MIIRANNWPGAPWRLRGPIPEAPPESGEGSGAGGAAADGAAKKDDAKAEKPAEKPAEKAPEKAAERPVEKAPERAEKPAEKVDRAAQVAKVDELDRVLEAKAKAVDEKLAALDAKYERQRQKAVVQALRKMGARADLVSDDDLLALAPKVDPDEPAGITALGKFRDARRGLFTIAEVGPQEALDSYAKTVKASKDIPDRIKERKLRMANRLMGGGE